MNIAILGAGIVGVTTAYELAADGHQVTVPLPDVIPFQINPESLQRTVEANVADGEGGDGTSLHGHAFQVVAFNGKAFAGAMRDTVHVPPMAKVTIAFDADSAGQWLLHCHNTYHMAAGMITEVAYV